MIENMERCGLSHRICCTASWLGFYWTEPEMGRFLARATNEGIASALARYPNRLLGLATVPLQDVEGAVEELRHAIGVLGLAGVAVGTNVNGAYFDDPRFDPFFEVVQELEVPVFFHPDEVAGRERMGDYWLTRLLGNPHEAALSLSRVILGGVLERFPRLRLCFPLGGGTFAYLLGRIEHGWRVRPEARVKAPKRPLTYLGRCYFDTIVHSQASFEFLVRTVPVSNLVLGSDYPWDMGDPDPRRLVEVAANLTPSQRADVLGRNVERLLGIRLSQTRERQVDDLGSAPEGRG